MSHTVEAFRSFLISVFPKNSLERGNPQADCFPLGMAHVFGFIDTSIAHIILLTHNVRYVDEQ